MAESRREILPLHSSVEHRVMSRIKILLPLTKDINKKNDKGYTVFLLACDQNDQEIFDLLLTRTDIDIAVCTNEGFTALHILAFRGNLRGITKVLEIFPDADINALSNKGNTPLIEACKENHAPVAQYLLERGANARLYHYEYQYTALHYAACYGHLQCVGLLLKYDVAIDARDNYGYTPLMKASSWGFTDVSEALIRHGADVNVSSGHKTPLSGCCSFDKVEMVRMLIQYGANVNFPGGYSSALFECARRGSLGCAKELIEAGVDTEGMLPDGRTALDIAIEKNHQELVDLLSRY